MLSRILKKVRRFRAKTDKSISKIRSDNWDNRKENRIKKKGKGYFADNTLFF
jgi:hypothetical protein